MGSKDGNKLGADTGCLDGNKLTSADGVALNIAVGKNVDGWVGLKLGCGIESLPGEFRQFMLL